MSIEQLKAAIKENNAARAAVQSDLDYYGTRNCAAVVRLSDRLWDIQARGQMLCRMFDAATA
jgi:hypothetical protein